ncbi:MAG TPA: nuclear transport factor 2 family protein [Kofleriaceae bacterium]|nr:nuclear transport factor 2 family protein [Kofleriaceae bacterium]
MTTLEIGKKLVELCQQGKHMEAMETLYAPDIVSVEAAAMPGLPAEVRGRDAVLAKGKTWSENHTVHAGTCEGPFPHGDRFIVRFSYDVTHKPTSARRKLDEMALFTVKGGKIVREEFFYVTG